MDDAGRHRTSRFRNTIMASKSGIDQRNGWSRADFFRIRGENGLTATGKGGYTGFCPSCCYETGFSVIDKNDRTLFNCHAGGCTQQQLIQALGKYELRGDQAAQSGLFSAQRSAPSRKIYGAEAALGICKLAFVAAEFRWGVV